MNNKVKDGNFITIQAFMVKDLQLKGNELLIYAVIYGFSQNGEDAFSGSLSYICEWTNSTKQGVLKNLKALIDKGLIEKKETYKNGVKFNEYRATEFTPIKQSLTGGIKQSLPNNIDINNIDKMIDIDIQPKAEMAPLTFEIKNDSLGKLDPFTNHLLRTNFLTVEDDLLSWSSLFTKALVNYDFDLVRDVTNYVVKRMKRTDISDKLAYFQTAFETELDKMERQRNLERELGASAYFLPIDRVAI